jgi:hypothetical protein
VCSVDLGPWRRRLACTASWAESEAEPSLGSNNWYRSRYSRSEKAKPAKKSRASYMTGAPDVVTKGRLSGFSPTSCSDGGRAHIRRGEHPPIMLVFWVGKAQKPYMLLAPVDLEPVGAQARIEPGRLQASSKIKNSVVTTGFNNWYQSPWSEKAKPATNLSRITHKRRSPLKEGPRHDVLATQLV